MSRKSFARLPMDRLESFGANPSIQWLWHGYLARGNLTLLTSLWKAGKTTLVAGLLQRLGEGGDFLGRACIPGKAVVVSEESPDLWVERLRTIPLGSHASLIARPFVTRPTPDDWNELIDDALAQRAAGELDLFVVDPLASFLPGRSESDVNALLEMLHPLQRLAASGVAVLVSHHPRKSRSEEGSSARGSGALLGFVDVILELHGCGRMQSDECRRRLVSRSRHQTTPRQIVYEWDPASGAFTTIADPHASSFQSNWEQLRRVLARRTSPCTIEELLRDWPPRGDKPSATTLLAWLHLALDANYVCRLGVGRKADPYRYRLTEEDDSYRDRGELPPLRELELPGITD